MQVVTQNNDSNEVVHHEKSFERKNGFCGLMGSEFDGDKEILNEVLYRVAASSAACGGISNLSYSHIKGMVFLNEEGDVASEEKSNSALFDFKCCGELSKRLDEKQSDGYRINTHKYANLDNLVTNSPISWVRGSMVDVADDMDITILFGNIDKIENIYDYLHDTQTFNIMNEWALRGEDFGEECDELLGEGKLLLNDFPSNKSISSIEAEANILPDSSCNNASDQKCISLREYADLLPLNVSDGGYTDNTGIGRAVMEGASHIVSIAFNT